MQKLFLAPFLAAGIALACHGAIPENDHFATRIPLVGTNLSTSGHNSGATREIDEPDPSFLSSKSVWWTWTAPADGYLTLSTAGSSFDTMITVFTGIALSNLDLVAFNDVETNTSLVSLNVTAGVPYQIAIDGAGGATGQIALALSLAPVQGPPANDHFANRITLTGSHLNNIPGSNLGASAEADEPFHADTIGLKSVWWTWTAPASGGVTLTSQGSSIDTAVAVYTGTSLANLALVAANDEDPLSPFGLESRVTFNAISNVTYQIAVDGYEGDSGDIRLRLDLDVAFPVPSNDNFANRKPIAGNNISTNGTTVGASYEPGEPMHMLTFGGKSVWFTWTAPANGGVTLTASNGTLDTIVAVYRGNSLGNLVFVAGNDEDFLTTIDGDSTVYFNATNGTTYQIAVDGFDGAAGIFNLKLALGSIDPAPANDNFASRPLISGNDVSRSTSNIGATFEVGEPLHRGYYGGKSVWWRWTSPGPGFVTVDTIGSLCDTLLGIYTNTTLTNLVEIASDDESGGNYTSLVTFPTRSNVTYQIAVDGYDNDGYDINLRVRFSQASYSLTVTTNPPVAGTVTINPLPDQGGNYAPGAVVTLTAMPAPGSVFTGWSGSLVSTNNPITFLMSSNKTITASFFIIPTTKVWTGGSNPSGNWSVSQNWGGSVPVPGDQLLFPAGAARLDANTNDFPANTVFKAILFGGADYILRGNAINLTNGIICTNTTGTNNINLGLQLGADQSIRSTNAAPRLVLDGNLSLGNRTLTVDNAGPVVLSGIVSGTGGIIKTNIGVLSLAGSNTNTYSGSTIVNQGTLELAKTGIAIAGPLVIGDGNGGSGADIVQLNAASQMANSSAVTINNSGLLDLNSFSSGVGSLTLTAGSVETGSGVLRLNGGVSVNAAAASASITGNLSLQGTTRTFTVANGAAPVDLLLSAGISDGGGNAGLVKSGNGTLQLSSSNSYAGPTTINQGTLAIVHPAALGATGQGTSVNTNGILSIQSNVAGEPLTLAGGMLLADAGSNVWQGTVSLASPSDISVSSNATLVLSGVISGAGALTKIGPGQLDFSGSAANTHNGLTTVEQGTLLLSKTTSNAIAGNLVIGDGAGGSGVDKVRLNATSQLANSSTVTISSSGLLDLNDFSSGVGALILTAGSVETGAGTLGLHGSVTVNAAAASASLAGKLSLQGTTRTFTVANGSAAVELLLSADISDGGGNAGLVKSGNGTLQLSGSNSYAGPTTINQGTLAIVHPAALGATAQGTTVDNDGTLLVKASVSGEPLTLSGGVLASDLGTNVWQADISLAQTSEVSVATSTTLVLEGIISGAGALTKIGPGLLAFAGSAPNTYAGLTTVEQGLLVLGKSTSNAVPADLVIGDGAGGSDADVLRLDGPQQIALAASVTVADSGLLDVKGYTNSIASLSGNGHVASSAGGGLGIGFDNSSSSFAGLISGGGGLTKAGLGTLTLSANNTYTGPTSIEQGRLLVNGLQPASSIILAPPGVLGGTGQVGSVSGAGTLSPGHSPGLLSCSDLTLSSNLTFRVELNGPGPGGGYDQLAIIGGVTLEGPLDATLDFVPSNGESFVIIDNDGSDAIIGTFAGLPQNSLLSLGQVQLQISYTAGAGSNDVVLTRVVPSAPSISSAVFSNDVAQIEGSGTPGLTYVLEAVLSLEPPLVWTAIGTNVADSNGLLQFSDPEAALHPMRFYRIRWP